MFYRLSEWKLLKINCIEMLQRKKSKKKKKSWEEWPRSQNRKTLNLPPPMGTPKSELFTQQLSIRMT